MSESAFDPSSQRFGEASWWSRRDFVKLSFATSGAIIAASFVGSKPKSYLVAGVGTDPYTGNVLDSIRQIPNVEIVSRLESHTRPDLIVIGASDLSDIRLLGLAANSPSSVLIVSHVCQPIPPWQRWHLPGYEKGASFMPAARDICCRGWFLYLNYSETGIANQIVCPSLRGPSLPETSSGYFPVGQSGLTRWHSGVLKTLVIADLHPRASAGCHESVSLLLL